METKENATKQQDTIWCYKYSTLFGAIVILIDALVMVLSMIVLYEYMIPESDAEVA